MKPEVGDLVFVIANDKTKFAAGEIGVVLNKCFYNSDVCMVSFINGGLGYWGVRESRLIVLSHKQERNKNV